MFFGGARIAAVKRSWLKLDFRAYFFKGLDEAIYSWGGKIKKEVKR